MKICPKCGAQKRDSEKFCDRCGSLLEVKNEAPVDIGATVYVSPLPDEEKTPAPAPQVAQPSAAPAPTPAPAPAPVAPPAPAKAPQPYAQPPMQPQMTQPQQPMQQPQFQAPQAPAYPVYAQQPQMAQQRPQAPVQPQQYQAPQAPVQQYQTQPQMAQQPQYRQAAPQPQYQQPMQQPQYQQPMQQPQYQQPMQQPQYQQPYAAPVQAPYQQYSPSAFPQKKGVDVLAIVACLLAIFIFIAPFLKSYTAKIGRYSDESNSQIFVVKQVIETLGDKVNSSLITQYRVLTLVFAVLIVVALAVWIPALIHACKGNNLKAWRFLTLTCIFALTANVCYMFAMKAFADAYNVVRDVRAVSFDPNAIFIVALILIVALLVTSIVKRSLMKKHPQSV